jgi:hypothetical protein
MADEIQPDAVHETVCMWCSAPLASPDLERCPSCGAILTGDLAEPLPGVTAVDAAALVRGTPTSVRPRNRLLSWISGDYPDDSLNAADTKALEPPDPAVRREMLRLELEGEVAHLKAEADALVAEAAAEGRVVAPPDISALSDSGVAAAEAALIGDDEAPEPAADVAAATADVAAVADGPEDDAVTAVADAPVADVDDATSVAEADADTAPEADPEAAPPA